MKLATAEDVTRLSPKVGNLCGLFRGYRAACEAEVMTQQTIQAAVINFKKHGEAYSILDDNARINSMRSADNGTALNWLLSDNFFVEAERGGKAVIFPTEKLILLLDSYFADKDG